jgi:hypothetical protein
MKLKAKLTKAQYDALDTNLKMFYKVSGNADEYLLEQAVFAAITDVPNADDDPGELRRALVREKQEAKDQKVRADRLQTQVDTLVSDPNKQKDLTTLENSWKQKNEDQKAADKKIIDKLTEQLKKTLVKDKARAIAIELAGENSEILLPHIESRLQANLDGDEPTTRVLKDGAISALSIDDLKKEFVDNKAFSRIIVASKASGGATGKDGKSGTSSAVPNGKKFSDLTEAERISWSKSDPEAFAAAAKEASEEARKALRRF